MSRLYDAIDLSSLPAPQAITTVVPDQEKSDLLALFYRLYPEYSTFLESDPAYKLIECFAYRLALEKQRRNEAIRGVMLAYAAGSDLDQLGANVNVARLVITPADNTVTPPVAAVMESDDDYRARIQLVPESYSTAGSVGSYAYWALKADADVGDVQVTSPTPGVVVLYVLSRSNNGQASDALVTKVLAAVNDEEIRPLTDRVSVKAATLVPYSVTATLELFNGPDQNVVKQAAITALQAYCDRTHKIGGMVATSGIYAALQQSGVRDVTLDSWMGNLVMADGQAPYCTSITISTTQVGDE
ncbi:baseplate assembly protein [Bombella pollinis]|uniref:Baseplate J/gp47 family protein n=1 Tax=Bombella pollinis TaxID=2967337 RepID=A0ABT3WMX7_9PROT|nr:baseplate J/gp47 family protein [Bombella pollinis]MCX5620502.1 baseplate J/gp47 family protein [Bombella pollinis]